MHVRLVVLHNVVGAVKLRSDGLLTDPVNPCLSTSSVVMVVVEAPRLMNDGPATSTTTTRRSRGIKVQAQQRSAIQRIPSADGLCSMAAAAYKYR